jgi:diadenosine tetraphosphate (Ap4A) HIT family hydrolase
VSASPGCPLCDADGGMVVVGGARWRLVRVQEAGFPAFYRLVWRTHVAEFSELPRAERIECMDVLAVAEGLLRSHLAPTKVNLASLGNMVPHLHWHLIARFDWDSHFPAPVWAPERRTPDPARLAAIEARLPALDAALAAGLSGMARLP